MNRARGVIVAVFTAALLGGCGYSPILFQEAIALDSPMPLRPEYVFTDARRDISPSCCYVIAAEGDRELHIYPGEHPFVVLVDRASGKAKRVGRSKDSGTPVAAGLRGYLGWETLLLPGGRMLELERDAQGRRAVLEFEHPRPSCRTPTPRYASADPLNRENGDAQVRRFDSATGWSQPVPESLYRVLLGLERDKSTSGDTP